jgi:predicted NUDIX family NTP pyrophosphohydrolase
MFIGMVLAEDHETNVPIVDGVIARIYDTNTGICLDSPNPALGLTEGRGGATIKWMVQKEVKVLCAPPGTLCELSYSKDQEENLNFYRLDPETSFSTFEGKLQKQKIGFIDSLPKYEIELSVVPGPLKEDKR